MRRMWLWVFAGLVVALGGWAAYTLFSPTTPSANRTLEDYVQRLSRKPNPTPSYIAFTGQARALAADMGRLQPQAQAGKWPEVAQGLEATRESYRQAWGLAARLDAESSLDALSKGFLAAADQALKAQMRVIDRILLVEENRLSLQKQALERERAQAEAELVQLRERAQAPRPEDKVGIELPTGTVYFSRQAVPWVALAFVAGFALLIPWYKRFAEEAQYFSYSLAGSARWTPTHILGIAAGAIAALVIAYLWWRGYLG